MFPSGVQCTHKMFQIHFRAFADGKNHFYSQQLFYQWDKWWSVVGPEYRSQLGTGIVLIHVQVAPCRCNRPKYKLAQLIGKNSLKIHPSALHECFSIYSPELRIKPQIFSIQMAQNKSAVLLCSMQHQEPLHVKKEVVASQPHAGSFRMSPGSIWHPQEMWDHCHRIHLCQGNSAKLSLLRGLPAHKGKLLQPILVLSVTLCCNQVI